MEVFRELWNGTWTSYVPKDENIRFLTENFASLFQIGFVAIAVAVIIPLILWRDRRSMRQCNDKEVTS